MKPIDLLIHKSSFIVYLVFLSSLTFIGTYFIWQGNETKKLVMYRYELLEIVILKADFTLKQ